MQPDNHPPTLNLQRNKQILFVVSAALFIMLGISGGLLNIAWTYMKDTFGVEVGAIGILLLFATSGSLVAAISSGTLIARLGLGRAATGAVFVLALGLAGIAFVPAWALVLAIIFVTYSGRGLLDAAMNNFISENYGTTAMNWLHASWGIGLTIAPAIMTFILVTQQWTWQAGYMLMAVVAAVMGFVLLASLSLWDTPLSNDDDADGGAAVQRASAWETIQQPAVLLSVLVFFSYGGLEIGTGQLVNTLFVDARDLPQDVASLWLSFYWGSFTVGRIALGWIALRVRDEALVRGGMALAVIGALLLASNLLPLMSVIGLMLIGIGLAGIFPILISRTALRVGRRFSAQAIGFQIGFAGFGAALLPGGIGAFAGQFGLEWISIGILLNSLLLVALYTLSKLTR